MNESELIQLLREILAELRSIKEGQLDAGWLHEEMEWVSTEFFNSMHHFNK